MQEVFDFHLTKSETLFIVLQSPETLQSITKTLNFEQTNSELLTIPLSGKCLVQALSIQLSRAIFQYMNNQDW